MAVARTSYKAETCRNGHLLTKKTKTGRCEECRDRSNVMRTYMRSRDNKRRVWNLRDALRRLNAAVNYELAGFNGSTKAHSDYEAVGKWLEQRGKDWNDVRDGGVVGCKIKT